MIKLRAWIFQDPDEMSTHFRFFLKFSFTDEKLRSWWTYTDINPASCEEFLRSIFPRKFDVTQTYEDGNIFRARFKREKIHRRSRCRQGSSPFPFQEDTRARNSVLFVLLYDPQKSQCFITPHLTGNLLVCYNTRCCESVFPEITRDAIEKKRRQNF